MKAALVLAFTFLPFLAHAKCYVADDVRCYSITYETANTMTVQARTNPKSEAACPSNGAIGTYKRQYNAFDQGSSMVDRQGSVVQKDDDGTLLVTPYDGSGPIIVSEIACPK